MSLLRMEKGSSEYFLANCWIARCVSFLLAFFCFHASPYLPATPSHPKDTQYVCVLDR